nr:uncharacterized protein LOC127310027 [Lolium perenne]
MGDPSGNPPTPPYFVPPSATATSAAPPPNPSGGADGGNPTDAARVLFVPLRGALHAGAAARADGRAGAGNARPAPRKGKASSNKRPHLSPAAVAPPKKAKAPVPRRQPPPPVLNQAPPPPPLPPTQPRAAARIGGSCSAIRAKQHRGSPQSMRVRPGVEGQRSSGETQ